MRRQVAQSQVQLGDRGGGRGQVRAQAVHARREIARCLVWRAIDALPFQPLHEAAVARGRSIRAPRPEFPGQPAGQQREGDAEPDTEHQREVLPVRIAEAESAQQVFLLQAIELHDPVVPARIDVVPDHAGLPQEAAVVGEPALQQVLCGQRGRGPALNALRCDRGRRIDAGPAGVRKPDLGPGMRMRLAQDQVAADRVPFAALVAADDPRRDAGGAHHHRESGRKVAAETLARVEQEIVHRVALEAGRRQRVVERLVAEHREHRAREFPVAARRGAHALRELDRARIAAGWQLQLQVAQCHARVSRRLRSRETSAPGTAAPS